MPGFAPHRRLSTRYEMDRLGVVRFNRSPAPISGLVGAQIPRQSLVLRRSYTQPRLHRAPRWPLRPHAPGLFTPPLPYTHFFTIPPHNTTRQRKPHNFLHRFRQRPSTRLRHRGTPRFVRTARTSLIRLARFAARTALRLNRLAAARRRARVLCRRRMRVMRHHPQPAVSQRHQHRTDHEYDPQPTHSP